MSDRIVIQHKPAALPVPWQRLPVPAGSSIQDIAESCYGANDGLAAWVQDPDGSWRRVPTEFWSCVKPKRSNVIRFTYRPHGGKVGNLFAAVAAIALAVVAPFLGGVIAGAFFGGSTLAAYAIGAGIAIGGSLALSALFPPEQGSLLGRAEAKESNAYQDVTTDGNVLAKNAFLPIVVGERRISPPDIIQPRAYLEDGIQTIDRCVALYGRHAISDVWIDGTPVDSIPAITTTIKDGDEATGVYTFIDEISAPITIGEELSTFAADGTAVEDQEAPSNSEPRWHSFSTPGHEKLEEIAIRLRFDGFVTSDSATQKIRIPIRLRFRKKGDETWNNLPEMHITGRVTSTLIREIRLRWDENFGAEDIDGELVWQFWQTVPAAGVTLSDESTGNQWEAADYFDGAGDENTSVTHISAQRFGVRVFLDEATFPKGAIEWQIMRGLALNNDALDDDYEISGTVNSLFVSYDDANTWSIPVDQGGFLARITPVQATAIATRYPTEWPLTALIALKSKGNSVRNITAKAARYVKDWDGSAWTTATATSKNPATHFRQILHDWCTFYGIDTDLIDDTTLVAWRQECIDRGYECSAVFAGDTVAEALDALATAGFAKKRISDGFGVDYFRDRSDDVPVQTFSPRNTESIQFSITSPQKPFGYRVSFQNEDDEWRDDELEVALDNAADIGNYEGIQYKAISKSSLVRQRATFDLLQINERRRQWTIQTAIEGVVCETGDLVSVVSDLFDDKSHGARIRQVIDGKHLVIDQIIPGDDPGPDLDDSPGPTVEQIFTTAGDKTVAFIQTKHDPGDDESPADPTGSGVIMRTITNVLGDVIELDEALPEEDVVGAHINITTLSRATGRCFVVSIDRLDEERAKLTLVDEAPQIVTKMQEMFG